jgi:DnaJ-class molecular chaperone
MSCDSPFVILGVSAEADNTVIRKAYHSLALQWHPDKNPSPKAQEMFERINDAYAILTDPEKRRQYLSSHAARSQSASFNRVRSSTELDNLYNSFYGPTAGRRSRTNDDPQRQSQLPSRSGSEDCDGSLDIHVSVPCSLEEMHTAAVKLLTIQRRKENGKFETKTIKITLVPGTEDRKVIRLRVRQTDSSGITAETSSSQLCRFRTRGSQGSAETFSSR